MSSRNDKIVGGILIGLGLFALVVSTWGLIEMWSTAARYFDRIRSSQPSLSYFLFKSHYKILLPIFTVASGTIILLKGKRGWQTGLVVSLLNVAGFILSIMQLINEGGSIELTAIAVAAVIPLLFFAIFLYLFNQIRKENLSKKTWITITSVTVILLLDNLLISNI